MLRVGVPIPSTTTTSMPIFILALIVVLALTAGAESSQQQAPAAAPAPAPAGGCTVLLAKVSDCLQYVTPGSPLGQPPEKCCAEVNSGVKDPAAVACVCGLLAGHTFGLPLNETRAAGLPVACGAPATSLAQCNAPPAVPTGGTGASLSSKSAVIRFPITAVLVVASFLMSGYHF